MLKDVLRPQGIVDLSTNQEYTGRDVTYISVLRDSTLFPNEEINKLVDYIEKKRAKHNFTLSFDNKSILPSGFVLPYRNSQDTSLPEQRYMLSSNVGDHQDLVPVYTLCRIVDVGSRLRDYFEGIISTSNYIELRAKAFRAEVLLTIQEIAEQEHIDLGWNPYRIILDENLPMRGLAGLPPGVNYPTPYRSTHI